MYQPPTRAQLRILRVIRDFQEANRYPPTVRQILAALGLNSTGGMAWHLRRMQEQGFLAERSSTRECWQILTRLADRPDERCEMWLLPNVRESDRRPARRASIWFSRQGPTGARQRTDLKIELEVTQWQLVLSAWATHFRPAVMGASYT